MPDNNTVPAKKYSAQEAIRRRKSVRTYTRQPVPSALQADIRAYISNLSGPFCAKVRIALLDRDDALAEAGSRLGTYGVIQGASLFAAAAVDQGEAHHLEQLGYVFEDLVLYVTSLGLGTCWMGGTFSRSGFSQALGIKEGEILPVISPIGYPSHHKGPIDWLFKPQPGRVIRKPWEALFFQGDFSRPLTREDAGPYALPLDMVRLAPSAANRQPWRVVRNENRFHFYLAHDPLYAGRHAFDIQKIDLGIALFHWEASVREQGLPGSWRLLPQDPASPPKGMEYIVTWEQTGGHSE